MRFAFIIHPTTCSSNSSLFHRQSQSCSNPLLSHIWFGKQPQGTNTTCNQPTFIQVYNFSFQFLAFPSCSNHLPRSCTSFSLCFWIVSPWLYFSEFNQPLTDLRKIKITIMFDQSHLFDYGKLHMYLYQKINHSSICHTLQSWVLNVCLFACSVDGIQGRAHVLRIPWNQQRDRGGCGQVPRHGQERARREQRDHQPQLWQ